MAAVGEDGKDGDGVDEDDLDDGLPGADPGVDARRVRHSLKQESIFCKNFEENRLFEQKIVLIIRLFSNL